MKNKAFRRFYLLSLGGVLLASFYPLLMGVRVVRDMIVQGTVMGADYPKYIIPYLPISLAVIAGVALMPLLLRAWKQYALAGASALGLGVFLTSELMLENWVIVTDTVMSTLESWQMYMCYVPPEWFETRTWRAVDILIGEYSPWFKLHFYAIAVVLILAMLNSFYGFGRITVGEGRERLRPLILQSVSTALFLGLIDRVLFITLGDEKGDASVTRLAHYRFVSYAIGLGVYRVAVFGNR